MILEPGAGCPAGAVALGRGHRAGSSLLWALPLAQRPRGRVHDPHFGRGAPDEARSGLGAAERPGGSILSRQPRRWGTCWLLSTSRQSMSLFHLVRAFPLVNMSRRFTALGPRRNPLPWHWAGQLLGGDTLPSGQGAGCRLPWEFA